jgi:cell filamentation protein
MREYDYAGADFYLYPGTKTLINKLKIKNSEQLAEIECIITLAKDAAFELNPIKGDFSLNYLCKIHHYLFSDIYSWAGKIRGGDYMVKGDTIFFRAVYIERGFADFYGRLSNENFLQGLKSADFCKKLAYFMGELNAIHPFREGNGRTSRLYFKRLAENAGFKLKFSNVTKDELLAADIAAFNRKYEPLIAVLGKAVGGLAE